MIPTNGSVIKPVWESSMGYVTANGAQLWVQDSAPGDLSRPVAVFSHALFFDSSMFVHQIAAFGGTHRVICYDHRGQGRSEHADGAALTVDALAADGAALIEALGVAGCHFVGNSLGGFVALRLAARRPDLVASVAVLGSSGEAEHKVAQFAPLIEAMRSQGVAPHIDTVMYIMFGDSFLADPARAEARAHWRGKIAALPGSIADSAHAVVFRESILEELAGTRVPVLAIAGGEDHAYGPREAEAVAQASAGRAVTVAQAGHSVALEAAGEVNALLAGFWGA